MEVKKIKLSINEKGILNEENYNIILEAYHNYFVTIYGMDFFDSVLKVTNIPYNRSDNVKKFSLNYNRAEEVMESFKNKNILLLMVYYKKNLIAVARLRYINEEEASIEDFVFIEKNIDEKLILNKIYEFVENYFKNYEIKKLYVNIPLKSHVSLLATSIHAGFREDSENISIDPIPKVYCLNKNIKGNIHNESSISN